MEDKKILNEYKRVQRSSWKNMPLTDKSKKLIEAAKTAHQEKAIKGKVSGLDSKKRWGNSGLKGHGVNSPAMMEARKGFNK